MSDAFDPTTQPPPDPAPGPPPPPGQDPAPPPMLNPFDPFRRPPQRMAQLDPEEQRWRDRTQPSGTPPAEPPPPQPEPPKLAPTPQPAQGKLPPPWPPKWVANRRQFYVPASGNRGPGGWGTPRQFPMQPPIWQVPDILMGIGQQLSQFGPPGIAMLALGMNRYTKAFMDGLHKGQREFARQHKQHAKRHAQQLDQQTQGMLDEYRQAFSESSDPDDQQDLEQKIGEIAQRYNDQRMLNELQNNGIQGVINQLNWFDAKHSDLRATRGAQDQADERLQASNPFMLNPVDDMGVPTTRQPPPFKVTPETLTTPPQPMRLAGAMPTPDTMPDTSSVENHPHIGAGPGNELQDPGAYRPARPTWPDQPPDERDQGNPDDPADEEGFRRTPSDQQEKPQRIPNEPVFPPSRPGKPPTKEPKKEPFTDEDFEQQEQDEEFERSHKDELEKRYQEEQRQYRRGLGQETAQAGKPVRLAQADTGTATDAPPPGAQAADEPDPFEQAGSPFAQAETRARLKAAGALPGYGDQPAAAKLPTPEELHANKQKEVDAEEAAAPLQMTPALTAIKQKTPDADLRMIDGVARRKFLGQLSASEQKELAKAGLLDAVNQRQNELEATADDIIGRAQRGELKPEDALNEIRTKLGPRMASDVQAILQGMGTGRANLSKPPFDKILGLARTVEPNLNQAQLDNRKRTLGSFTGNAGNAQIIVSSVHALQLGADLEKHLGNMPSYARMTEYNLLAKVNKRAASAAFPDVAEWLGHMDAGKVFVAEAQKIFANGRPTMTERFAMQEDIDWNDPVRATEFIRQHERYLQWRIEDNKRIWDVGTKGMPGADKLFEQLIGDDPAVKRVWPQTKPGPDIYQRGGGFGDKAGGARQGDGKIHDYQEYFK